MEDLYKEINNRFGTSFSCNDDIVFDIFLSDNKIDISFLDTLVSHYSQMEKNRETLMISFFASKYEYLPDYFIEKYKSFLDWKYLSLYQKLSEDFIEKYSDLVDWEYISSCQKLSEEFILKHKSNISWKAICTSQQLSEKFIEDNIDNIVFHSITKYQVLSEEFIEKYKHIICWEDVSAYQKLSEEFIEKNKHYVDWLKISKFQKLSEDFIEKYSDFVDWDSISIYQKLSNEFIERNIKNVNLLNIQTYQKLSDDFIERNLFRLNPIYLLTYQKLSDDFIDKHKNEFRKYSIGGIWNNKSTEFKKQVVVSTGKYDCYDDYFIAYKSIRPDRYSLFNFQYKYEKGGVYESNCDCTYSDDSFGLNVGTNEFAESYGYTNMPGNFIVRCKVRYEDVGRVIKNGRKIRCFKIEILD